jgi:uncharacterized membrane protein
MIAEAIVVALALVVAFALRPWRQDIGALATPLLASLVIVPWLWALPTLSRSPIQLQWSGACLVVLMLGWPLAIPVLCIVGLASGWIGGWSWDQQLDAITWLGVVPATLALGVGALIRRLVGAHMFVYIIGRAFLGSVLCLFVAGALRQWFGNELHGLGTELSLVGRWLTAWGDAFVTGMVTAVFVAFRPQWLATWSDTLYLRKSKP